MANSDSDYVPVEDSDSDAYMPTAADRLDTQSAQILRLRQQNNNYKDENKNLKEEIARLKRRNRNLSNNSRQTARKRLSGSNNNNNNNNNDDTRHYKQTARKTLSGNPKPKITRDDKLIKRIDELQRDLDLHKNWHKISLDAMKRTIADLKQRNKDLDDENGNLEEATDNTIFKLREENANLQAQIQNLQGSQVNRAINQRRNLTIGPYVTHFEISSWNTSRYQISWNDNNNSHNTNNN